MTCRLHAASTVGISGLSFVPLCSVSGVCAGSPSLSLPQKDAYGVPSFAGGPQTCPPVVVASPPPRKAFAAALVLSYVPFLQTASNVPPGAPLPCNRAPQSPPCNAPPPLCTLPRLPRVRRCGLSSLLMNHRRRRSHLSSNTGECPHCSEYRCPPWHSR